VLVFRGEGITNDVGWEVKVAASNGAGSSDFSDAMAFTPTSNQEPQLRDSGVIWVNTFDKDGEKKSQINLSGQGAGLVNVSVFLVQKFLCLRNVLVLTFDH